MPNYMSISIGPSALSHWIRHSIFFSIVKKTYEDFAAGLLTESRFKQLSGSYETEQTSLSKQTAELQAQLEQFDRDNLRADKFLELARRYTDFTELTAPLLHEFVQKVIVHEAVKIDGNREQKVEVFLNHIGAFAIPGETSADGESNKWRDYKRNQRARTKLEQEYRQIEKTA